MDALAHIERAERLVAEAEMVRFGSPAVNAAHLAHCATARAQIARARIELERLALVVRVDDDLAPGQCCDHCPDSQKPAAVAPAAGSE